MQHPRAAASRGAAPRCPTFALLRQAQQIVVSNSTFSWWAAALGRASTVVSPIPWFNVASAGTENLAQTR